MNKITHQSPLNKTKLGQFYTRIDNENEEQETYILAKGDGKFILICLNDGEYWSYPTAEIDSAFGTPQQAQQFKLVTQPFTIIPEQ